MAMYCRKMYKTRKNTPKREKIHQNEKKYAKTREEMSQKRETKSTKKNNEKSAFNFSRSYGARLYTAKLIYKNTQP